MKMQIVHPTVQAPIDLDLPGRLERIEKNWAPFATDGDRALLSRSINPHEVGPQSQRGPGPKSLAAATRASQRDKRCALHRF